MIPRSLPKIRSGYKKSARRVNRRAAAFSLALAAMLSAALPFSPRALAADTVVTVVPGATDLSQAASYSGSALPTATNDVLFTGTYTTPTFNVNGAALTLGTLDDNTTQALTLGDTSGTPGSLTLSSVQNLTASTGAGNAADVLFVRSGGSLTINNVAVNIAVNAGNNIDTAGTLIFGATSTLSLGANVTTNFSGAGTTTINGNIGNTSGGLTVAAGTLTLAGTNAYTGATTLAAGTLNLNSANALGGTTDNFGNPLGTSGLTINGGTLNNTSGAAVTLAFNAPITLGGTLTFGTAASTSANNLNLGTGAITMAASRNVNFAGTGTTLTLGGALSYTGVATATTGVGGGLPVLTVNGAGNTLVLGGLVLNSTTGSTVVTTFGIAGVGNTTINGPITNGNTFANGLIYNTLAQTGTLSLLGTNTYTGLTTISSATLNLGGDNTAATGGLSISTSALNLLTSTALGTGTFGINSGSAAVSINNISGAALTETNNPAINFNGNFGFNIPNNATATSANNLNLGAGAVTFTNSREAYLGGTGTTLTFGGTLSNLTTGSQTMPVFGAGNTLVLGALNLAANTTGTQTFNVIGNGNFTIPGVIANGGAGTNQFFINGIGTYTLGGTNTFTGPEQISGGTLVLDYSTNNTTKLSASTLVLGGNIGGGTVTLSGGSFAQTVGNTNLNYGAAAFTRASGTSTLALGGISRAVGATVNFIPGGFVTTTTGNTNGIIGGYATFNATAGAADWTANVGTGGTAPTQFTGYSAFVPSNVTPGANGDGANPQLTGSSALTGNVITNSLKIISNTGLAQSLTVPTGSALALTSGGLLYTGSDAYTISGGALRTNAATAAANDVIVQQYGAGALTISSAITDGNFGSSTFGSAASTSLTKMGPGTLILGAANTYSGSTYVNAGTLQFGAAGSVLPTSALVVNGTADLHGFSQDVDAFNGTGTVVNNGTGAATFSVGNGNGGGTYYGSINNGTGTLGFTKNGNNTVSLYGANTYSGPTVVNGGTLNVQGQFGSIANSTSLTVTGNGALNVGDLNGPAGRINPAAVLTLGGANGGGSFFTARIASGTQNISLASLNVGVGTSRVSNILGTTADSGYLVVTGASGANFSRAAGGFFTYDSGGGDLTIAFSNQITGPVSGTGTSQIVIGGISNGGGGSGFMGPAASINGLALGSTAGPATTAVANGGVVSTANANINLTNAATAATNATATTAGPLTINAIQFSGSGNAANTDTLTLGGALTISSGGILAGNGTATGGVITGGSVTTGSAQDLWVYNNTALTIASPITDSNANAATNDLSGGLSKGGSGVLTLSGASTFAGPIYLTQGSLGINNANATGTASALGLTTSTAPIYMTGGTLQALSNFTTARNFVLGGGADTNFVSTASIVSGTNTPFAIVLNGVIGSQGTQSTNIGANAGQLSIASTVLIGTTTTTVPGGSVTLGGANTFTGGTTVGVGATLYLNNTLALQNSQFNGGAGTLVFGAPGGATTLTAFTFGGLGNSTNLALTNNATTPAPVTLTVGNNNLNASTSGILSGTGGSVTKVGTGTQTFTSANTFTGALRVNGGTVNASAASGAANFASITALSASTGGTLLLSGASTVRISDTAPVTMGGGAINLAPASREGTALNRTGAGTTSQTSANSVGLGMLTLTANSSINFLGTSGTLVIGTGAASAFDPSGSNFTLTVSGTNFGTTTLGSENINDRLVFNQSAAPTTTQLSDIFFNQGGTVYAATFSQIGTTAYYDIIPSAMVAVPEPSTWVAGLLCLGTLGFSQRRRIGGLLSKKAV